MSRTVVALGSMSKTPVLLSGSSAVVAFRWERMLSSESMYKLLNVRSLVVDSHE